jgi:hypothetical protein
MRILQRKTIIILLIIGILVAIYPSSNEKRNLDLVRTLNANRTLFDGEIVQERWEDMEGDTNIKVLIKSTEAIQVVLTGENGVSDTFYNLIQENHGVQPTRQYSTYNVTIWNPREIGDGEKAQMLGTINAYHVYYSTEWLPWWMT